MSSYGVPPLRAVRRRLGRLLVKAGLLKPILPYLEFHLADRCNLNCRGCSHYSPIAEPWYADPARHEKDMRQLRKHFRNIMRIRLLGGEPLLHPDVEAFLPPTRRIWPQARIHLVTNGLLLRRMPQRFWRTCRDHDITIDWTVYPPLADQYESMHEFVSARGVILQSHRTTEFCKSLNLDGDSDPEQAFRACRSRYFCPFLREGRLYICWNPALAHHANRVLGTQIPSDGFVDLYAPGLTGRKIMDALQTPARVCRFCSSTFLSFEWGRSRGELAEWDARPAVARNGHDPTKEVPHITCISAKRPQETSSLA